MHIKTEERQNAPLTISGKEEEEEQEAFFLILPDLFPSVGEKEGRGGAGGRGVVETEGGSKRRLFPQSFSTVLPRLSSLGASSGMEKKNPFFPSSSSTFFNFHFFLFHLN